MKINSITQCLKPGVECSLYVDDFQVCYRSSNMSITERQLHAYLPFRSTAFSGQKSPVVEETKFLGVIFDRKLSFVPIS